MGNNNDRISKPLGDCLSYVIDHRGKTPKKLGSDWVDEGVPALSAKNVNGGRLVAEGAIRHVTPGVYKRWMNTGDVKRGDCFLVSEGATLGECMYWDEDYPIVLSQRLFCLRADSSVLYPRFFYFYMTSHEFQEEINGRATGSSVFGLRQTDVLKLRVELPPMEQQRFIGDTLYSLNKKIELNRRMNETLEGMAQALFKSWFVDFDPVIDNALEAGNPIPDEFAARAETRRKALADGTANREAAKAFPAAFKETEEMGWIPEGWEMMKLKDVCDRIFSGGTPRTKENDYWNGGIPWLSSGETGQRFILETDKFISEEGVKNSSTRETRTGAVVIASAGQGKTRGQTSYLCFDSYINQSVIALEANNSMLPDAFLFFDLARRYEEFRQLSDAHSSRGSLTTKLLATIDLVIPCSELLSEFGAVASNAINKIAANARQNMELSKLRDTLLPKLISGELRIEDAEKMVGEV